MKRPAERIQLGAGAVLGALQILYGVLRDGFQFSDLDAPEVTGAATILISAVATMVTRWVAARQRTGELQSLPDGTVAKGGGS